MTDLERMVREHKRAGERAGGPEETELLGLLRAHEHFDAAAKARTILLPEPAYRRALRLSRIVDQKRGLERYATIRTLCESITGRRVE